MHRTCSRLRIQRPVAAVALALVLTFGCGSPPKPMKGFIDELTGAGLIPMSLITWQLTGDRPAWLH